MYPNGKRKPGKALDVANTRFSGATGTHCNHYSNGIISTTHSAEDQLYHTASVEQWLV